MVQSRCCHCCHQYCLQSSRSIGLSLAFRMCTDWSHRHLQHQYRVFLKPSKPSIECTTWHHSARLARLRRSTCDRWRVTFMKSLLLLLNRCRRWIMLFSKVAMSQLSMRNSETAILQVEKCGLLQLAQQNASWIYASHSLFHRPTIRNSREGLMLSRNIGQQSEEKCYRFSSWHLAAGKHMQTFAQIAEGWNPTPCSIMSWGCDRASWTFQA